jgi:DNA polymerase-3 subunit gamma/tau
MAVITLANKYRPKTFADVVEQGAVKLILQEQLKTGTQKNCYLFTGGAGTGKTTCARIFANEINKHQGNPIEIDAASNNGVENVREIIDNAKFKALDAPYKVYIIDECHMLSTGAWNAMLKLLEEPPAQTIFIMCTTDPQKIPATILSRVQRYDFQRITFEGIVSRLKYICKQEGVEATSEALDYIANLADGGCRDSITLLDKCISYDANITIKSAVEALGTVDYDTMFDLTECIAEGKQAKLIAIVEGVHRTGIDLKQFMKQYSLFLLSVAKYYLLGTFKYVQIPSLYKERLKTVTEITDYEFLLGLLHDVIGLNNAIKWETAPKPLIESTLLLISR